MKSVVGGKMRDVGRGDLLWVKLFSKGVNMRGNEKVGIMLGVSTITSIAVGRKVES